MLSHNLFRYLENRQCTSIIVNFDEQTIENIKIMTVEDDIDVDIPVESGKIEEEKQSSILDYIVDDDIKKKIQSKQESNLENKVVKPRKRKPKRKLFQVIDTSSDASSASGKQQMAVSFDEDNEMLFIGLIDTRNDKPSFEKLQSMLNDQDRYNTQFWDAFSIGHVVQ